MGLEIGGFSKMGANQGKQDEKVSTDSQNTAKKPADSPLPSLREIATCTVNTPSKQRAEIQQKIEIFNQLISSSTMFIDRCPERSVSCSDLDSCFQLYQNLEVVKCESPNRTYTLSSSTVDSASVFDNDASSEYGKNGRDVNSCEDVVFDPENATEMLELYLQEFDNCECKFVKEGREEKSATLKELSEHYQHVLNSHYLSHKLVGRTMHQYFDNLLPSESEGEDMAKLQCHGCGHGHENEKSEKVDVHQSAVTTLMKKMCAPVDPVCGCNCSGAGRFDDSIRLSRKQKKMIRNRLAKENTTGGRHDVHRCRILSGFARKVRDSETIGEEFKTASATTSV